MSDAGKQVPMRLVGWTLARQISRIIKRKKNFVLEAKLEYTEPLFDKKKIYI